MKDWNEQMAPVDIDVDAELGDRVQFSPGGANPFIDINLFVSPAGWDIPEQPLDASGTARERVLVSRSLLPSITHAMRFIVPQIAPAPQKWRPENWLSIRNGRYWLVDLQKAS